MIIGPGYDLLGLFDLEKYFCNYKHCLRYAGAILCGFKVTHERRYGVQGSRNGFMKSFLEALNHDYLSIKIHFESPVTDLDISSGRVQMKGEDLKFDLIVGADGAGSIVRNCVQK